MIVSARAFERWPNMRNDVRWSSIKSKDSNADMLGGGHHGGVVQAWGSLTTRYEGWRIERHCLSGLDIMEHGS